MLFHSDFHENYQRVLLMLLYMQLNVQHELEDPKNNGNYFNEMLFENN